MGKQKLTQQQIEVAVKWWCDILRGPKKFSGLSDEERRSGQNRSYEMAEMMATLTAVENRPQDDKVAKFGEKLAELLANIGFWHGSGIGVDYNPDATLRAALDAAGIRIGMTTLPWKTSMSFYNGGVEVHCGYGAPVEKLL